jgi:N-dimethylarginine dimethylaminohydrolase
MGMVVLGGKRAVVSRLQFGDAEQAALAGAVQARAPVMSRYAFLDEKTVVPVLSERLQTVSREYEEYAEALEGLGVEVHRSSVQWEHVLASMSWTNVVQAGDRILMPLYPDSLRGVTTAVARDGGQTRLSIDVSGVGEEKFELTGENLLNYELYESLGYEVVPVPEYLHYMGGGLHCFVNVLE